MHPLRREAARSDGTIGFAKDLREILRKDQLATLGEVAIGLSHEINNPLSVILNQAELLERDVGVLAGERDTSVEVERLDAVRREIARISEILQRLGEMVERENYETIDYLGPARMIDLRRRHGGKGDPRLRDLRILVVDDDLGICRSLKEILEGDGCRVVTAQDGEEALGCVEADPFDLVLTDVVMPRMDGYDLFVKLRETHPDLPVLMMTAFTYDKDHVIKRSRVSGLHNVIFKKPVDPDRPARRDPRRGLRLLGRVAPQRVRATQTPVTRCAPARRRARAAEARVAPVVATSSTRITGTSGSSRARNAPVTFRRRARRWRPVWLGVSRTRTRARGSSRPPVARATSRASSRAGLKPRERRRRGCRGTGTTRPASASAGRASTMSRRSTAPGRGSRAARPEPGYLKRCTQDSVSPA